MSSGNCKGKQKMNFPTYVLLGKVWYILFDVTTKTSSHGINSTHFEHLTYCLYITLCLKTSKSQKYTNGPFNYLKLNRTVATWHRY